MSTIEEKIRNLATSRNTIRDSLVKWGVASNTDKLEVLASTIKGMGDAKVVDITIKEGESTTIPAGYHTGAGTVKAVANEAADLLKYNTQKKENIYPSDTQDITVTPDQGYYALSSVTVKKIPDKYKDISNVTLTKDKVLKGEVFIDKNGIETTGEMPNNYGVSAVLDEATGSYTIPKGYHDGTGVVTFYPAELDVTPSLQPQTFNAFGELYVKVNVAAIPDNYLDMNEPANHLGSDDLTTSGKTVTVPAGYYPNGATKDVQVYGTNGTVELVVSAFDATEDQGIMYDANIGAYVDHITVLLHPELEQALAEI